MSRESHKKKTRTEDSTRPRIIVRAILFSIHGIALLCMTAGVLLIDPQISSEPPPQNFGAAYVILGLGISLTFLSILAAFPFLFLRKIAALSMKDVAAFFLLPPLILGLGILLLSLQMD